MIKQILAEQWMKADVAEVGGEGWAKARSYKA